MAYVIAENAPSSLRAQWAKVYLEQAGVYRVIEIRQRIAADIDAYVQANFAQLWNDAEAIDQDAWLAAEEDQFLELYRAVVRAGIHAARQGGATLPDVSDAMEAAIAQDTTKANQLSALQSLASGTTAGERDRFFLLVSFIVLGKIASR